MLESEGLLSSSSSAPLEGTRERFVTWSSCMGDARRWCAASGVEVGVRFCWSVEEGRLGVREADDEEMDAVEVLTGVLLVVVLMLLASVPLLVLVLATELRVLQLPAESRRSLPLSVTLSLPPVSLWIFPASSDVLRESTLLNMPGIASSSQTEYSSSSCSWAGSCVLVLLTCC